MHYAAPQQFDRKFYAAQKCPTFAIASIKPATPARRMGLQIGQRWLMMTKRARSSADRASAF
jgi:hypothetical protein